MRRGTFSHGVKVLLVISGKTESSRNSASVSGISTFLHILTIDFMFFDEDNSVKLEGK